MPASIPGCNDAILPDQTSTADQATLSGEFIADSGRYWRGKNIHERHTSKGHAKPTGCQTEFLRGNKRQQSPLAPTRPRKTEVTHVKYRVSECLSMFPTTNKKATYSVQKEPWRVKMARISRLLKSTFHCLKSLPNSSVKLPMGRSCRLAGRVSVREK